MHADDGPVVVNTTPIIGLSLVEQSLIPSVGPVLRTLKKGGFYLSTPLIEEAIRLAGE